MNEAPVRLCCGTRHFTGERCPDGRVMCCVCFGRFPLNELNRLPSGDLEDVCAPCAERESR